jgi:hypothetical protein
MSVEAQRGLEPERIAGAKPGRNQIDVTAGVQNGLPDAIGLLRRHEQLEPVFARVASA